MQNFEPLQRFRHNGKLAAAGFGGGIAPSHGIWPCDVVITSVRGALRTDGLTFTVA